MGAFDGYWGGYGGYAGSDGSSTKVTYAYFKTQPSFNFHDRLGMPELKVLCAEAEASKSDTVWVLNERPGHGHIGLSTWYVRALINEFDKE